MKVTFHVDKAENINPFTDNRKLSVAPEYHDLNVKDRLILLPLLQQWINNETQKINALVERSKGL
jgi:hypothetical protein